MDTNRSAGKQWKRRPAWVQGGIFLDLIIWTCIAVVVFMVVEIIFARLASDDWFWEGGHGLNSGQWYDVTRSAIATAGLFGLGGAALLAYRRQRTTEGHHQLEKDSDLRGRYAQAAEQLGHERPAVRLAGVYAMAALADDWHAVGNLAQQRVCVDVLCAYLRMPYDPSSKIAKSGEKEVRLTIIKTITERLQDPVSPNSWSGFSLDFTGAVFDDGSFNGAKFTGGHISFQRAKFIGGDITFHGVQLAGGDVSFNKAEFTGGHVTFGGTRFTDGHFSFNRAKFNGGDVTFGFTKFKGQHVTFHEAEFSDGNVSFDNANIMSGGLSFNKASFTGGKVSFRSTELTSGDITFQGALFAGGDISFVGAKLTGNRVSFNFARFTSGKVIFSGVKVASPCYLDFSQPRAWGSPPDVPWGTGATPSYVLPDVWPPALDLERKI